MLPSSTEKQLLVNTKKKLAEEIRDRRKIAILLEIKNQECSSLKEKIQNYEKKNKALRDKISNATTIHKSSKDHIQINKVMSSREQQLAANVPLQNTLNKRPFPSPIARVKEICSTKKNGGHEVDKIQPPVQKKQKYVKKRIISKEMAEQIELNRQKALARRREKMNKQKYM